MSYHVVSIDAPRCSITVARGQLIVAEDNGATHSIPLEDVASIVVTSFKCTMTNAFLVEAARHRVGLVVCDSYAPATLMLPVDRATDTAIIRNLANLSLQSKRRLWAKTLNAKCMNQCMLAENWIAGHETIPLMKKLARSEKETRESEVAKMYWGIFADKWCGGIFVRRKDGSGVNALLNYAYAILLSLVLRNLLAFGIDPTFGIFHQSRAHATPLAYDLMEPFRIAFDCRVANWICAHPELSQEDFAVTKEYRQFIGNTLDMVLDYEGKNLSLRATVEHVVRSFRKTVEQNQVGPYTPWTTSTTKWDG